MTIRMTSFFPDLNVWLALSVADHAHSSEAWNWFGLVPDGSRVAFARYTHLGLLRLLTNESVMGDQTLTLRRAWSVYDRWLKDPRVAFYPESRAIDTTLRAMTSRLEKRNASKWLRDCYLLAFAKESGSSLVTFDKALLGFAHKHGYAAISPR